MRNNGFRDHWLWSLHSLCRNPYLSQNIAVLGEDCDNVEIIPAGNTGDVLRGVSGVRRVRVEVVGFRRRKGFERRQCGLQEGGQRFLGHSVGSYGKRWEADCKS